MVENQTKAHPVFCPFTENGHCYEECMLLLVHSPSDRAYAEVKECDDENLNIHCSFAVLASHIASDVHAGGSYLMPNVSINGYFLDTEAKE